MKSTHIFCLLVTTLLLSGSVFFTSQASEKTLYDVVSAALNGDKKSRKLLSQGAGYYGPSIVKELEDVFDKAPLHDRQKTRDILETFRRRFIGLAQNIENGGFLQVEQVQQIAVVAIAQLFDLHENALPTLRKLKLLTVPQVVSGNPLSYEELQVIKEVVTPELMENMADMLHDLYHAAHEEFRGDVYKIIETFIEYVATNVVWESIDVVRTTDISYDFEEYVVSAQNKKLTQVYEAFAAMKKHIECIVEEDSVDVKSPRALNMSVIMRSIDEFEALTSIHLPSLFTAAKTRVAKMTQAPQMEEAVVVEITHEDGLVMYRNERSV